MFVLIVDDFGIENVGDEHVQHLQRVLEEHYTITTDWKGEKFAISKHANFAFRRERTLLMINFTRSSPAVGVPTSMR